MDVQAIEVNGVLMLVCGYAAACDTGTLKAYQHPVLGPVPICTKHAAFAGVEDRLIDCEVSR
jgi:hypothetical protein